MPAGISERNARTFTPTARRRQRLPHRRRRQWLLALAAVALLPLIGVAALWPLTPSVADAERRISDRLAAHQARDPGALSRPDKVGVAVVATEDSRFFGPSRSGRRGRTAAVGTTIRGARQDAGGATLDQQLAKNLYTGSTALAEVLQIELSFKLEARFSKTEILEMHLSEVYYGHGSYGLTAAARGYFGVAPARWPKRRQRHVLDRLVATHILTSREADAAYAAPLSLR